MTIPPYTPCSILSVLSLTLDPLHHFLYLSTIVLTPYSSVGPGALFRTSLCPRCVMGPRATPPPSAKACGMRGRLATDNRWPRETSQGLLWRILTTVAAYQNIDLLRESVPNNCCQRLSTKSKTNRVKVIW